MATSPFPGRWLAKPAKTREKDDELNCPVKVTDALGQTTRITHTATGLPQTVTRPDLKSEHYEWNALNRLTRHVQPSGATARWTYTPEGFT
ncbi:hypothetical protein CB172_23175, partial [Salmonella enterica subsp. enterica serovar Claibornei]|nr:hypothetical protein [Salmonella enterica subsp. enterica serovar Claibornei]